MYTYIMMLIDCINNNTFHWYVFFVSVIFLRWLIISFNSFRYKPYICDNKDFYTSVIIPVVDEPLDLFKDVLTRIYEQYPNEIIVVINGPENVRLLNMCKKFRQSIKEDKENKDVTIKVIYTNRPGKRNAIKLGVRSTDRNSDIIVLVDSDTLWTKDTLENLLMPFSCDETIGGVTTRQKIIKPGRNIITMTAALLEEIRAEGTMKAMSARHKVGCLPGRTIAFRTKLVRQAMNEFMSETFMGIHKEVSDDRSLTNIVLKMGYKAVLQDTSLVFTDCPLELKRFLRQQLRWAEGSQYNNIRMSPWMWKNSKLMFFIYWFDMLLPFLLISTYTNAILCYVFRLSGFNIHAINYTIPLWLSIVLIFVGAGFNVGVRNFKALLQLPPYFVLLLPFIVLILSLIMSPLRIIGLMKCADGLDWGTRNIDDQTFYEEYYET